MAMKNSAIFNDLGLVNGRVNSYGDDALQVSVINGSNEKESEKSEHDILEDFESYWEDINNRLIISRMVSDSVIKGMVNAVEQEAAEKIAQKELELAGFKKTLNLYHVGVDESESFGSLGMLLEPGSAKRGAYSTLSDAFFHYDRIGESVARLKNVAKEQLKSLRKELDRIRGSSSIRRMGSHSEMVGLGGILQDKVSDIKWIDVDKTLDSLRTTMDTICKQVDNMVYLSKASLCQWQQEREFQGEIEDMVIMNCIWNLKEEFEERLWDQYTWIYCSESVSWLEKIKELSNLRQELNAISKSLSVPEIGHLTSHGTMEVGEECNNSKKTDHLHSKASGDHVTLPTSLWEGNGKHDESVIAVPENLDFAQLKHMSKEELVVYFKTEMTKMKRNHEHRVQEITEEYFTLKREYLRERGSSLPFKKDKEFDALRKKVPDIIMKLDDILVENEKLPTFCKNAENLCSLKDRLETLLSENCQLRGMLTDKKREVKRLSSHVSETAEIMVQHCLSETNLVKRIGNLQCAVEDVHIETSIREDVCKCLLREVLDSSKSVTEQTDMEYKIMQEIYETIFRDAAQNAEPGSEYEFEDSDLESVMMQGLCAVIFRESLREAEEKLNDLNLKYINENELRVAIETEVFQKEEALRLGFAEKERLKQETLSLSLLMEEKGKLAKDAEAALMKEKDRFKLVYQELDNLRDERSRQEILICESSEECSVLKGNLSKTMEQIELYKVEVHELKQKLELAMKESRETNEEKRILLSITQEMQNSVLVVEDKDKEQEKQMQSLIILVQGLVKAIADFECRVMEDIKRSNTRLENVSSQLRALVQKAKITKRTELMYKQRLERQCADLQKAEAEVDLLGDEVDTLLSLLEKIYIALDHYSPVLQHYPGIIEILKLVRRELSGEPTKPA